MNETLKELPEEYKQEIRDLVGKIKEHFDSMKYGESINVTDLSTLLNVTSKKAVTAINILRMNGVLIIENSNGLFLARNKEQYDIWWRLYMQPAMQSLIAIQKGMSPNAKKLPKILRVVEANDQNKNKN